ncbi:hypothetical protein SAMN05421821_101503 [Mucilaginibacter lappiensis]|uniref:Uncharacterized protein n=1 Tax=Mucilaginibacter lappiensis TaxID=354630 RepID=A0ABR6PCU2_9SPHI|nr:hypothetical protein [Mucilaginibacter lappiensis]SIQ03869.1 hypothetical protein SAMN05421821_101503 [Mucilaginibacter lappiensis]
MIIVTGEIPAVVSQSFFPHGYASIPTSLFLIKEMISIDHLLKWSGWESGRTFNSSFTID